jgi:hypothetical protein
MEKASPDELKQLLAPTGEVIVGDDHIEIRNYLFEPSVAFGRTTFHAAEIGDLDLTAHPPTMRIDRELIFLTAEKKAELDAFAQRNKVKIASREPIWDWILEPFLDTEFTRDQEARLESLLALHGLDPGIVGEIRKEVEVQMIKYNFDTMLWAWTGLGACDVLRAMRTAYDRDVFRIFYRRVMAVALAGG